MILVLIFGSVCVLMIQTIAGFTFIISSIKEKETRATILGGIQFGLMFAFLILFLVLVHMDFFKTGLGLTFLILINVYGLFLYLFLVKRLGKNTNALKGSSGLIVDHVERFDERKTVFSRGRLQPETDEYNTFYKDNPEHEERDAKSREKGGPLGEMGLLDRPYEKPNLAALTSVSFFSFSLSAPDRVTPKRMIRLGKDFNISSEEATERIKGYTSSLGADLVGIAKINPLWMYSHRGSASGSEKWGNEIALNHKYAVVFTTEMDFEMVRTAPHSASTVETMRNYAEGARISTTLASYIANLGYSATAQHVGHYDMLLVPTAVDAGLGELGRHGYLITKEYGPRVRLAGVTTDLPLLTDRPKDIGVFDFCKICKKCATCCPSGSIPEADATPVNGILRWKLNAETCHDFWGKVGSDCNVCMHVCPWSHAKTFPHRMIAESVSRNLISRRLFNTMDDLFYGKNPLPQNAPAWAHFKEWGSS